MKQRKNSGSINKQIAFYLSLDEVLDTIKSYTQLDELHEIKSAALLDLAPSKWLPRWASQSIKHCINDRIQEVERVHAMLNG